VTLYNRGDMPVVIQSSTATWSQREGKDIYDPSDALLVAPAIAEVPAGGMQVFRITTRKALPTSGEQAYRLYLEDVTAPEDGSGLNLRVRHNLPVTAGGQNAKGPVPILGACSLSRHCLRVENAGGRHLKIEKLEIAGADHNRSLTIGKTVLAGAWKEFDLGQQVQSTEPLKITAHTTMGNISIRLPAHVE
jgi:fimbrial chaperone protein